MKASPDWNVLSFHICIVGTSLCKPLPFARSLAPDSEDSRLPFLYTVPPCTDHALLNAWPSLLLPLRTSTTTALPPTSHHTLLFLPKISVKYLHG